MKIIGIIVAVVLLFALSWLIATAFVAIAANIAGWTITTGEAFGAGLLLAVASANSSR